MSVENNPTSLLDEEANQHLYRLLGNRCITLSTTVIQLYCTKGPSHTQWQKKDTGILCFVKDNIRKNYFFRLFCLKRNLQIWEHEMYNNMDYIESTSYLHLFEGEDCLYAFNFADRREANKFKMVVEKKIEMKKRRREKARHHTGNSHFSNKTISNNNLLSTATSINDPHAFRPSPNDPNSKLAKRKRNLTKADIGTPSDFKHISHVGWDPHSGFDINSQDEQLKDFFQKAGVSEKQLQDRDTREFIYDFINKHGGRKAVAETNVAPMTNDSPPLPPIPPRSSGRPHVRAAPPPPPNAVNYEQSRPQVNHMPSPISSIEKPPLPPPPQLTMQSAYAPQPPIGAPAPPPPPPPPPLDEMVEPQQNIAAPPPPIMNNNSNSSQLMESIRSGTTLKPASERKLAPAENPRNDLLDEIRKGCKLKPVDERDIKPAGNLPSDNSVDLAGALARALQERSKKIHSEDEEEEDDDEEFNDEDWD